MMKDYLTFDFGESFFRDQKVIEFVLDKMPVSISLGLMDNTTCLFNFYTFRNKKSN